MLSDTLLHIEQRHVLLLLAWGGLSFVTATAVAVALAVARTRSALLEQFAVQMAGWGAVIALFAATQWPRLADRDLAAAARLEHVVWMTIGLDAGVVMCGVAVACCAWALARRLGIVGAGIGLVVQGLGLLVVQVQLAARISS